MAASRWGNADREKPTFKDFQCQVGDRNVNDAGANQNMMPSSQTHKEIPVSAAVTSTAPKLPDVAYEKTVIDVRTCEMSFRT